MVQNFGKLFIFVGVILITVGILLSITKIGRLPGDIIIKKNNFVFYFPIVSSILISIILSLILFIIFNK